MKLKFYAAIITSVLFSKSVSAQEELKRCGTDAVIKQLYTDHPELMKAAVEQEMAYGSKMALGKKAEDTTVYIIPVVFHVLHQNGPENISDAQIADAMVILNRDFRMLNSDTNSIIPKFKGLASDIRIEFRLAQIDPDGNCTNGIDRIYTSRTNYGDDSAKVNPWPREKYLNIWTAKALLQGWAGYAYYPSAATGPLIVHDGLMVLAEYVGSIGTSNVNKSRTLTHEVGHWLNLGHPWNTTINISINVGLACGNDLIDDTPFTKGHTNCPSNLLTPDCAVRDFTDGVFNFNAVTTSSGNADPSVIAGDYDSLTVTPFHAVNVSSQPDQNGSFSFSKWPSGAVDGDTAYNALTGVLDSTKYYEITIGPKSGASSMKITGLNFKVSRSSSGPRTYAVRSGEDHFTSNLAASVAPANADLNVRTGRVFFFVHDTTILDSGSSITVSGLASDYRSTPVTFRIYAWNAEDSLGSFTIDDVSVKGSTGVIENIQNYMEYSYCTNMFTKGQKDRMRQAVEAAVSGRSNLWSAPNLLATGVSTPHTTCAPVADFYASGTRICKGSSVTFTKNILRGAETSRVWKFEGGFPATSTDESPSVKYNTPGVYAVTLTATNTAGTDTVTKTGYIRVDSATAEIKLNSAYSEGFENPTILDHTWQSQDNDHNGHKWEYAAHSGINGSNAVVMTAFNNYGEDIDELISPSFDLTTAANKSLTFRVAAASTSTDSIPNNGVLKVFFSTNCGITWAQRGFFTATTLINNPPTVSSFVPNTNTTWSQKSIPIATSHQTNNVRIKFQYKSNYGGNNVYIDDLAISETVGVNELNPDNTNFTIYPNPTAATATVSYSLNTEATTEIMVFDMLGKKVVQLAPVIQSAGDHSVVLSKNEYRLTNGIYFVQLRVNNQTITQKLIFAE